MKIKITNVWIMVCELSLAKEILWLLDCGQRRQDADNLLVFDSKDDWRFRINESSSKTPIANLRVDEGIFDGAMHRLEGMPGRDGENTIIRSSWSFNEYVDWADLLRIVVKKLIPDAQYRPCFAMGHGTRQQNSIDQSIEFLRIWSELNPDASIKFI